MRRTRKAGCLFLCIIIQILGPAVYAQSAAAPPAEGQTFWLWNFLGRLHPLLVHFPVGFLLLAAIAELFTLKQFNSRLRSGINLLVYAGAFSAVLAAIFGLLLATNGDYGADALSLHQWSGIATAVLGTISSTLLVLILRRNKIQWVKVYRGLLFFTAISLSVAGHFGASLTHGSDYLTSALPFSKDYQETTPFNVDFASVKNDTAKLSPKQELELNVQVRGILAHNCYKCHGAEKVKGELRLDSKSMAFKGGEDGLVIVPGKPEESEIIRRITLPRNHKEAMPSKGKKLKDQEIELLTYWVKKGAPWPAGGDKQPVFRLANLEPRTPALPAGASKAGNLIDLWVNEYFKKNKISWPALVDDRTYLRRIYLDIIGLTPTPKELDSFSTDARPDKRAVWVRKLLNRDDDYALNWLTFWNDALRNDYTGTGYITGGRFNITDWLYKSLRDNKPYDRFVRELISPDSTSRGFIKGIKWRGVVNASQRPEMQAAQNVAQVFIGLNLKCASCHNSFVSDWKLDDAYAFANIFGDSSLEINRCDKPTGKFTNARQLWKELGEIDSKASSAKKQKQLSENFTKPENGRLYRTIVNRIWAQMMGRGIVEPVDVMDNVPWSQDLLDWMATNFVENKSDIREMIYLIATSNTYQLPSVGFKEPSYVTADNYKFQGRLKRRMSAEQFADALSNILAPVFPDSLVRYKPVKPSGSDKSSNLPVRASIVENNQFLTALGRPNRETVSTSRETQANLLQALEFTNGERFNSVLRRGAENWKQKYRDPETIVKEIYRHALGREPRKAEFAIARKELGDRPDTNSVQDLFWALMLLPEFQIIN